MKMVCLDFDGVVHSYTSEWKGACHIPDPPVSQAFAAIKNYIDSGIKVAIYSTRNIEPGGIAAMQRWFAQHCMPATYLDKIEFPSSKPSHATLFVDDRGWEFRGIFPAVEYIKTFKPWNKV